MIKAIFFDIDGTLIPFGSHEMPESTLRMLHALREKGIYLFISTGRHKNMVGFLDGTFRFDGYITMNGQYCFNSTALIHRCVIDKSAVAAMMDQAEQGLYHCFFLEEDGMFSCFDDEETKEISDSFDLPPLVLRDRQYALETDIFQINAYIRKEDEHIIFDRAKHVKGARWHPEFLDIIPDGGSKEAGLRAVIKHYNIRREETMAFGDGGNDIEMLSYAGIGVAMGNASDEVKAAADFVTTSVDDDGIAYTVSHFELL